MRAFVLTSLAALCLGAHHHPHHHRFHRPNDCPYVGVADLDSQGAVQNLTGDAPPRPGREVFAFAVDGAAGKFRAERKGKLRIWGKLPARVANATFTHVLLTDRRGLKVAEPGKDLPQGVFPDAVEMLLAGHKGAEVVLISIPGDANNDACSEIQCKSRGGWHRCWTDCKAQ